MSLFVKRTSKPAVPHSTFVPDPYIRHALRQRIKPRRVSQKTPSTLALEAT